MQILFLGSVVIVLMTELLPVSVYGLNVLSYLAGLPEEATPVGGLHTPAVNPGFLCSTAQFLFMCPIFLQA